MYKNVAKIIGIAIVASMIFYCGQAYKVVNDAAANDGGTDAGAPPGDGGINPCINCPEPEPHTRIEVYDIQTSPDSSAIIPVPDFNNGVIIQTYQRASSGAGAFWRMGGEDCQVQVWTEPHAGYPGLELPAIVYPQGLHRQCRVVILSPE